MISAHSVFTDVQKIRSEAPLVHNITNYVVMNTTANALLSLGASPVMAHAIEEVEEMVAIARALVINIGTLSKHWIDSMVKAAAAAKRRGIPIILDPVGAGATRLRTETAHKLIVEAPPTIIRGNASEIRALYHTEGTTKGVDSTHSSDEALDAARELSRRYNCAVSVSGAVDHIVYGDSVIRIHNGHPLMPKVTGLGCTASALTGAFAAVNSSPLAAAAHAMAVMGIAGELAASKSSGPGTLQLHFYDALYKLQLSDVESHLKVDQ
ncbi:MAG: hydroxyethylthiazole kinase [Bacteroidetes bacterium]|nr:hydroxyethylthiazole kinase [Bacteroidota bacterium]